jgi:apolipoprotein A-IV
MAEMSSSKVLEGLKAIILPELAEIKRTQAVITTRLDGIDKRFDDLRADMNQRFEAVDKRFDDLRTDMNQRFGELRADIDRRLNDSRAEIDKRLDDLKIAMNGRAEDLRVDLNARFVEARVEQNKRYDEFRADIKTWLGEMSGRMGRIEDDIRYLRDQKVDQETVNQLDKSLSNLLIRVDVLEQQVQTKLVKMRPKKQVTAKQSAG